MESNKIDVLHAVRLERSIDFAYPDEMIFSNVYHVSLSTALRSMESMEGKLEGCNDNFLKEYNKRLTDNQWITAESEKATDIPVINFDRVVGLLENDSASCDALFYNFYLAGEGYHFIIEFKNSIKPKMLKLLDQDDKDGIYNKVRDSVEIIRHNLLFGGTQESEDIIRNMHFCIVYDGKNTSAVTTTSNHILGKSSPSKDKNGKQCRASRMQHVTASQKGINEIYRRFEEKIEALGMKPCYKSTFPISTRPELKKAKSGSDKLRYITAFSSKDFGDLINSGFFDAWDWGAYSSSDDIVQEDSAAQMTGRT